MPTPKTPPPWAQTFLDALARTGNVRVSAEMAGVDVTSAYNRRSRYPEFREAWGRVLAEREARAGGGVAKEAAPPPSCGWSPSPAFAGEESQLIARSTATGVKLARVGTRRWGPRAEDRFLGALAASANVKRSAAAAGFSPEAVYKRRLRHPSFAAAWDAAIEVGKARIEAYLVEAADRTFDPETLPIGEGSPKVSVAEAIHILRLKGPSTSLRTGGAGAGARRESMRGFAVPGPEYDDPDEEEVEGAADRIMARLGRIGEQERERKLAAGWSEHDGEWVPPGFALLEGPRD